MTPIKGLAKQGLFALQQFDMTPLKGLAKQRLFALQKFDMTPIKGLAKHRLPPVDEWGYYYLLFWILPKIRKTCLHGWTRAYTYPGEILVLQFSWKLFTEIGVKSSKKMEMEVKRIGKAVYRIKEATRRRAKTTPRRGIEPRSPAWQAGILATILSRIDSTFYSYWRCRFQVTQTKRINRKIKWK